MLHASQRSLEKSLAVFGAEKFNILHALLVNLYNLSYTFHTVKFLNIELRTILIEILQFLGRQIFIQEMYKSVTRRLKAMLYLYEIRQTVMHTKTFV